MRLPWKKSKLSTPNAVEKTIDASFGGDLEDFAVLRHHAIRALCGALMDRHAACRSPHPFCGVEDRDAVHEFIATVIPQMRPNSNVPDLIAIYMCGASALANMNTEEKWDPMEYISQMVPTEPAPSRKLVVFPPEGRTYVAMFGPILNPVEGNYYTGGIDPAKARPLNCNPEPRHCRWKYWESSLDRGDWQFLRFHCLHVHGEWWIVDIVDEHVVEEDGPGGKRLYQQVAALDFADNPEHNFGIHEAKGPTIYTTRDPDSEHAKVLRENLPPWQG